MIMKAAVQLLKEEYELFSDNDNLNVLIYQLPWL